MKSIKKIDGTIFEFEEFEPKEQNLIKINLNDNGSANGEGIWACISDDDKLVYDANVNDHGQYNRVATLQNDSYQFPMPTWGMYIMYTLNGDNRPVCDLSKFDFSEPVFCELETVGK